MSLKTDNFKLYKYEDNDIGDLRFINDSMDMIDKGINPFYVATLDSANTYKIVTGLNKTSLVNGYSIKAAIPSNSTGAVSITVDSVTVPVKKPNGGAVTNFKANGVYSLTYYNSVFILASGGGADTVNFTSDKLLTGYSANDSNGEKVNGTMPDRGSIQTSEDVVSYNNYLYFRSIPSGYYHDTTNSTSYYPEINASFANVATALGLTANKIVAGNTICGVTGTATADRLLLTKSGTAIIAGSGVTISGSTFTDRDNYLIFNHCVDNGKHYISLFTKQIYNNEIIDLNEISNDKIDINEQRTDGVYYYWHNGNLIYNRGNASSWDGKTFKYRIYKITDMINF